MELPPLHFFGTMLKMKKIEVKNKQINIEIEVIGIQRYPPPPGLGIWEDFLQPTPLFACQDFFI